MRPYLTILIDSFREAFVSRTLWVLLVLSTLFLAAVAPISLTEKVGSRLHARDVVDVEGLIVETLKQDSAPAASPGKQVWKHLDAGLKKELSPLADGKGDKDRLSPAISRFRDDLNRVLTKDGFYDADSWSGVGLTAEAESLLDEGVAELSHDRLARLNRLLLEAAYPRHINVSTEQEVFFGYLTFEAERPMGLTKDFMISWTLRQFTDRFLGVGGVFLAILVTASVIPRMFEPGAIDLLLSKPVSRTFVFLTKFIGGCAFIFVVTAYLVVGLWLIVGIRMDYWNHRLLLCIPLLLFLFSIYYSVSALAGVIWKNTILCVVMAVLFWATCYGVWLGKHFVLEQFYLEPTRINRLVPAGDSLIAVNQFNQVQTWNDQQSAWEEAFAPGDLSHPAMSFGIREPLVGPVYDAQEDRLLAVARSVFTRPGSDGERLQIAQRSSDWSKVEGPAVPADVSHLFVRRDGTIIAVASGGIFAIDGKSVRQEATPARSNSGNKQEKPAPAAGSPVRFRSVGPTMLGSPLAASMDATTGTLAVFDARGLMILETDAQGRYAVRKSLPLAVERAPALALADSTLLLALSDGTVRVYDAASLEIRGEHRPDAKHWAPLVRISPDGRWCAAVTENRNLWLLDARTGEAVDFHWTGQGNISAVEFLDDDLLAVVDAFNRVTQYDLAAREVHRQLAPRLTTAEWIYWYILTPLYTVFPKPGELGNMVAYLMTGKETTSQENALGEEREKLDVWGPIWSNLAFLAVVLSLSCLYIRRRDF